MLGMLLLLLSSVLSSGTLSTGKKQLEKRIADIQKEIQQKKDKIIEIQNELVQLGNHFQEAENSLDSNEEQERQELMEFEILEQKSKEIETLEQGLEALEQFLKILEQKLKDPKILE